ncbi:MAG TPA: hypothetical protein VNO32_59155, partial [Candidatus Acidoferrum sp.]|nr:hypothetical protein [Candidatus Acidoferrum sp.]
QPDERLARARQGADLARVSLIGLGVTPPQQFNALGINFDFGLAQQLVGEQASAYADLVDAPDRELDALGIECRLLGENMLIDVSTTARRPGRTESR